MELAELLESEGVDPDELMPWAFQRAAALLGELADDSDAAPLLALLESDASVDVSAVEFAVASARPISLDELPPPPEQPKLAEGEPEPLLETFDTGPIDLDTPEADALIAANSTEGEPEPEPSVEVDQLVLPPDADPAESDEDLEEIELDELVEIDDEELEMLDDDDEPEQASPPSPPPPPSSGPPPLSADPGEQQADEPVRTGDTATDLPTPAITPGESGEAPIQTGDTASFPIVEDEAPVQTGDTATHPVVEDETPVQTGDTATHPVVREPSDDFDLDFDDED